MLRPLVLALGLAGSTTLAFGETPPPYLGQWSGPDPGAGRFAEVAGLAIGPDGHVYAVDEHRVRRFRPDGSLVTGWGDHGAQPGQFSSPLDVDVDASGIVYVADTGNHRVQRFTGIGGGVTGWGGLGAGPGQFSQPSGIALDGQGNVYVADTGNRRIQKFDASGNYLLQWGAPGSGDGQFQTPFSIAVDDSGRVWVGDVHPDAPRVQVFTSTGAFLFARPATEPRAIAAGNGRVYVADASVPRIFGYDHADTVVVRWGTVGIGHGQFLTLRGLAVAPNGDVFASDPRCYRVQRFGGPPAAPPAIALVVPAQALPGTFLSVFGSGFHAGVAALTLAGTPLPFTVMSDSLIESVIGFGHSSGDLVVETWAGFASAPFVVVDPPIEIHQFTPEAGVPGAVVTIFGAWFEPATEVVFGGAAADSVTYLDPSRLLAMVPAGAASGPIVVRDGARADTSSQTFTVYGPEDAPIVEAMEPDSGLAGTRMKLRGRHFTGVTSIGFAGTAASPEIESQSDTLLVLYVPPGAFTGAVHLRHPADTTDAGTFSVTPRVFAEATLGAAPGLGGTPSGEATLATVGSGTIDLHVTIVAGGLPPSQDLVTAIMKGTCEELQHLVWLLEGVRSDEVGDVRSEYRGGALASQVTPWTQSAHHVYLHGLACGGIVPVPAPVLATFTPKSGAPGTVVTITGQHFGRLGEVTFDGAPAAFTILSDGSATAVVPTGARSGPIGVSAPSGIDYAETSFEVDRTTPALVSEAGLEVAPGQVTLRWYASADLEAAEVERREGDTGAWRRMGAAEREGARLWRWIDRAVSAGTRYGYRLVVRDGAGEQRSAETVVDVPVLDFAFEGAVPNPSTGRPRLAFTLPRAGSVLVEAFDVAGRRTYARRLEGLEPGRHVLDAAASARPWLPGVYLVRITHGDRVLGRRVGIVR